MSKILFKMKENKLKASETDIKDFDEKKSEQIVLNENTPNKDANENERTNFVKDEKDFSGEENFDKQKYIKYYKKHPKKKFNTQVERYTPALNKGLNTAQVQKRFTQFLFNETNKNFSKSYASIFIGNICTFFNLLCLLAFIALILAGTQGITNYLVIIITTANIAIGIIQEIRSKRSIDRLSLLAESSVKVIRNGDQREISAKEIVLDDVIFLETGNQVPADCILAEGNVEVNESLLTGESVAVKKKIGDRLFAGSFISSGNGKFRVDRVGKETFINQLSGKAKKYKRPNSELMNSTKIIIKCISVAIVLISVFIFIITRNNYDPSSGVTDFIFDAKTNFALQRTCAVVIGMIPSGMLLLTSVALAVGVIRLSKNNTLVQDLYSLEMLARVNVLCLDKTGTITDGRMKVNDCVILNHVSNYTVNDIMGSMLEALQDNNQTSIALYNHFGYSDALTPKTVLPFSSKRKLSAVSFEEAGTFVMGAPEFVLRPMPAKIERMVKQYAHMGMRVLVLAHSNAQIQNDKIPALLKPIAIISITDNIRNDAVSTIKWFKDNDVNVKVISGDNPITVSEVARRAGIDGANKFISLEGLNEKEVANVANKYTVFGRVSPEQKAILIRSMKTEGNTVAMMGDGVNDILALKEADCAVSVASGSEAARNVSHLVLMDNNFSSMPKVVAEGRRVINNIKNSASLFLMKTLFTTILAVICILLNIPYLFLPQNMLLLELCVIGIPSFFLSLQPNNSRVEGKFISYVISRSVPGAIVMVLSVMAMYLTNIILPDITGNCYMAMCTLALTFSGLVMLYRVCQPFNLYRAILFILMTVFAIVAYSVPFISELFYKGWNELNWNYASLLMVIVVIQTAFPISKFLIGVMQVIMPSASSNNKKSNKAVKK